MEPVGQKEKTGDSQHLTRNLEVDVGRTGCSWKQIEKTALDRERWRSFVDDLVPGGTKGFELN